MNDELFMKEALLLAKLASKQNEVPVGSVVVFENEIIGKGYNQNIASSDPTAHAEIIALKQAGKKTNNYRLVNSVLYTTLEPCLMCVGAIIHARIEKVFFSASDPKSGFLVGKEAILSSNLLNHKFTYEGGLLEKESSDLLKSFFLKRRG